MLPFQVGKGYLDGVRILLPPPKKSLSLGAGDQVAKEVFRRVPQGTSAQHLLADFILSHKEEKGLP